VSGDPRQGDFLPDVDHLFSVDIDGAPTQLETPNGVVLLSQCCDLARGGTGEPVAGAVVHLSGSAAADAKSGRSPRYAHLEWLGPDVFVDFACAGALEHQLTVSSARTSVPTTEARRILASRIARRFSRFAYPDEVQQFLGRLRKRIRSKASSEESPLGQCLNRTLTIRIENESGWDTTPPWDLSVIFVLNEGELPTPGAEDVMTTASTVNNAAEEIAKLSPGSPGLSPLWGALADLLVADAMTVADPDIVSSAIGEVLEESEFSFYRYRRSADIDIDDLSE
jgi:hypothetical protein